MRLSESIVWQLQRELYNEHGIQAWAHGNVPQTITTTPYIARAYARVVLGYLRDIDPEEPVYIVELGAGSGRFGYRFIRQISQLFQASSIRQKRFRYVMTDVSPSIVEYWQHHPMLQPLVADGILEFAQFDATQPTDLPVGKPLVVIANYFFDSIPHDSFTIERHHLFENLVRLTSPTETPALGSLNLTFQGQPAPWPYYGDPVLDAMLEDYRERLDNVTLLFPIAAIRCIDHFRRLSDGNMLVIAADIGSSRDDDAREHAAGGVGVDRHFWLEVNFHAIGEYVRRLGGYALHPPFSPASLNVSAFVLGAEARELRLAYASDIGEQGPDDFFITTRMLASRYEKMEYGELLTFLHSTGWDSDYFLQALPVLMDKLDDTSWPSRSDIRHAVDEAWLQYYPMGHGADAGDLASGFGVLLYSIGEAASAMEYFLQSLSLFGEDARSTFNIALCLYRLERPSEALEWTDRTLALDPTAEEAEQAQELRATLVSGQGPCQ
jgi:tetratricopeptide (TPR) repeat protein